MFTPMRTSPAGLYLPYYMTTGAGGLNTSIQGNGAIAGADVLNNCVGFSQGRMAHMYCEDQGLSPQNPFTLFNMDAQNWLSAAINAGYSWGASPQLAAVGVYASRSDPTLGHVCNVEEYVNGIWYISEGHYYYPGGAGSWDYSYLNNSNYKPAFIEYDNDWYLLGFIYPFQVTPGPGPSPLPSHRRMKAWMYLKRLPF